LKWYGIECFNNVLIDQHLPASSPVGDGLVTQGTVPHVKVSNLKAFHRAVNPVGICASTNVDLEKEIFWYLCQLAQMIADPVDSKKTSVLER
jgi:hypothetical protein